MTSRMNSMISARVRALVGLATLACLVLGAGTADAAAILVNRTPTPPAAIVNDGTGVELYDWAIEFDTTPDHYIEFVLDPDYDMVQCVFHDLIGWNFPMPAQWQTCLYVDNSATWPQAAPVVGSDSWTAPANAETGRYEIRVQYYSIEVGSLWESEAAVVFYVAQALGDLDVLVWHDENADGIKDPSETGLPQWLVSVTGPLSLNFSKLTGPDGMINETDLPVGAYGLNLFMKPGWLATTPTGASTNVTTSTAGYAEFGVVFGGAIGDTVWHDANQDGVQDPTEDGIGDVTVNLYQDTDLDGSYETLVGTEVTNPDGGYLFDGLPAGDYLVDVDETTLPAGAWMLTTPPEPLAVTLDWEQELLEADFGYYPCGAELCDGLDNDCDGQIDEDFPLLGAACDGADLDLCENGTYTCASDGLDVECVNETETDIAEICDGLDNDCDGQTDEDFPLLGEACDGPDSDLCENGTLTCTADGLDVECVNEAGAGFTELCNGLDDDCDGQTDEDFPLLGDACDTADSDLCANGHLICFPQGLCRDPNGCEDNVYMCVEDLPANIVEVCNGADDDCDGLFDEGFGSTTCGVGACEVTQENCENGQVMNCVPGAPLPETCDLVDNNCNGEVDEGLGTLTCGTGICFNEVDYCVNGQVQTCEPGTAVAEDCNGLDDDCDGLVDEGLGSTTCGVGLCEMTTGNCVAGEWVTCEPGTPDVEVCDGLDNDCDGAVDEGLGTTTCGVGACMDQVDNCVGGQPQTCVPGTPGAEDCNGLDDDCDGAVDEGLGTVTCGIGECEVTMDACVHANWQDCIPGTPTPEICDGLDNDCDTGIDEGLGGTTCGVGACEESVANCVNGVPQTCVPGTPGVEICDGIDNDCDGAIDEGLGTTTCGTGQCQATVDNCVGGVPQTCVPYPPKTEVCDGADNDCDGAVDEDLGSTTCGVGECEATVDNCVAGQPQTCVPGAALPELCDGLDNDCDNEIDEGLGTTTCGVGACEETVANCMNGVPQTCVPGAPVAETCDLVDNDCDGAVDEGLGSTTCGVGDCEATVENCVNGQWQDCVPGAGGAEICDGADNDCDGAIDEGLGSTTCGVGACETTVDNCVGGQVQTCVPGGSGTEVCDGVDNDCDGAIDEELGSTTCGVGACEATIDNCIGGQPQTCVPGTPGGEVCDGLDNDCDGAVDEGLGQTTCGTGDCEATIDNCIGGQVQTCVPGAGGAEICDGADNDCDGAIDEGLGSTTCGVGACETTVDNCVGGQVQTCVPGGSGTEVCDGVDNDCDGAIDEELGSTTCGVGACEATIDNCIGGQPQACIPGTPGTEVCDGEDNDCDGAVDEDLGQTTCGVGACETTVDNCIGGQPQTCTPGAAGVEVCDGADNDCDGAIDEDLGTTTCGDGACEMTVDNCVGGQPQTCVPGTPGVEVCDGLDNDCDELVDEGLGSTTCGVGVCENTVDNCIDGVPQTCEPGVGGVEDCNGEDDDCDGAIDEDLGSSTCGIGECEATTENCVSGQWQDCQPGTPGVEICDGLDNDCDTGVDEDLGGTTCGVGACEASVANCENGVPQTCEPGAPSPEICDLVDNDCDGAIDEGLGSTTCGVGPCMHTVDNCIDGQTQSCDPFEGAAAELCDGIDNDCDGAIDEGFPVGEDCSVGGCGTEDYEVWAVADGDVPTVVYTGDALLFGSALACNFEHAYAGMTEYKEFFEDSLMVLAEGSPIVFYAWGAYDGGDYFAMADTLDDMIVDGAIDDYDLWDISESQPLDLEPGDLDGVELVILDAAPDTSASHFVVTEQARQVLADYAAAGGKIVGSAYIFVHWNDYTGYEYEAINMDLADLFGGVLPILGPHYGASITTAPSPAGAGMDLITLIGAEPWHVGPNDPFYHDFWGLEIPAIETACYAEGSYICLPDGGGVICDAVSFGGTGPELCGNGIDDDCDCEVDEGFEALGEACDDGAGACYTEGELVCSDDLLSLVCDAEASDPTDEICDGLDNDCDGDIDEGFGVLTCGVGECAAQIDECLDGAPQTCVPGTPGDELCDGLDNDCDGAIDEDLGVITCGVGACANEAPACVDGAPGDCVPLTGSYDICFDGIDNDCDGEADEDCYCVHDLTIVSDPATDANGVPAVPTWAEHPAWAAVSAQLPDSFWIWTEYLVSQPEVDTLVSFARTLRLHDDAVGITGSLEMSSDNDSDFWVGVNQVADLDFESVYYSIYTYDITPYLGAGDNALTWDVLNWAQPGGTAYTNPAGLIYEGHVSWMAPKTAEICNGLDDDCDGDIDEGFGSETCGVGACEVTVELCVDGETFGCIPGTPGVEICDGIDNDCDGLVDEDLGSTTCGTGLCQATVDNCVGGVPQTCVPGLPDVELCDGADNDCDGAIDEDLGTITCGAGACFNEVDACVGGAPQDCEPLPGSAELCDGVDNDCDGAADEDLGSTTCGVGICENTVDNCVDGQPVDCEPGAPGVEDCNGLDDDCDGAVDEDLGSSTCGIGECEVTVDSCVAGAWQDCVPGTPGEEICDGLDNDCDTGIDEDLGGTTCGVGACEASVENCVDGVWQDCVPGAPSEEVCDGVDNDCDGLVDEDLGTTTCGVGECEVTVDNCVDSGGDLQAFAAALPAQVDIILAHPGTTYGAPSYWDVTVLGTSILAGQFDDYCIDTDHTASPGVTYTVDVYSSYEVIPAGLVEYPENFDLLNYILNQGYVGTPSADGSLFTYGDVQRAIWTLIDDGLTTNGLGAWSQSRVDQILEDTLLNGDGYVPGCDDFIGVVLAPVNGEQVTIAQVTLALVAAACEPTIPECVPGTPTEEICDGLDNDCDAETDEELGVLTCGVGACYNEVAACIGGADQECLPLPAGEEICDGEDNDCDGEIDEGTDGAYYTVSQGSTSYTVFAYQGGVSAEDFYSYHAPKAWTSNTGYEKSDRSTFMLYEDPAGDLSFMLMTDKAKDGSGGTLNLSMLGLNPDATLLQKNDPTELHYTDTYDMETGAFTWLWYPCCNDGLVISDLEIGDDCLVLLPSNTSGFTGWDVISDGGARLEFPAPAEPIMICPTTCCTPTGAELCDGIDNDCDGDIDEGFGTITCGAGACEATVAECVDGVPQACVPGTPTDELCDGIDNDCDGVVDDGFGIITCGVGACAASADECVDGVPQACVPGTPSAELCDGIDNDCDGAVDEGLGLGDSCSMNPCGYEEGVPAVLQPCAETGVMVCADDGGVTCEGSGCRLATVWQLGVFNFDAGNAQAGGAEYPTNDAWSEVFDYTVVGSGDPAPAMPGYLSYVPMSEIDPTRPLIDGTAELKVHFNLMDPLSNGSLHFSRYGSEDNYVYLDLDGDLLAITTATEGQNAVYEIGLPALEAGEHVFSFVYAGGGANNGNYIDAIRLVAEDCSDLGPELCGDGMDNDCDCAIDEGFEALGDACDEGVGACYDEGELVCAADLLSLVCSAEAGAPGYEGYREGPYAAARVDDDEQGLGSWGGPIGTLRSDPEMGLTLTEANVEGTFFSMGYGGWIIVGFDCPVHNGDGPDVQVWEKTYGPNEWWPEETADVFAWDDAGQDWVFLGQASNQPYELQSNVHHEFDLGTLPYTSLIKIVDTTEVTATNNDAFDLNGVYALQACTDSCNGVDDDCDDEIDEDQGQTSCGVGACAHTIDNCVEGVWQVCDPLEGVSVEICDGVDNDCDGLVDEDLGTLTCGVGACFNEVEACIDGVPQECLPGAATDEVCDGVDNDCDGAIDEGFGTITCGLGLCQVTVEECVAGQPQSCVPGAPSCEVCDGLDNDCDGAVDEGLGTVTCGVGACQATVELCVGGVLQQCEPGTPAAELCDGIDNDCDGAVDEGLGVVSCGVGACYNEVEACLGGQTQSCVPGTPGAEICGDFEDNDCDGDIDEGCNTGDDCLLPEGCVGLSEAFARGWIIVDTPSSNSATVVLHNIGSAEVCLDENLMMFSDPTQTMSTPIKKYGSNNLVIPADGMLTLRYGPWTYPNGHYQPYLGKAPWWCFEAGQYATANTVFSYWGEATPPVLAYFLNNNTNTDNDNKEDHVDWAGSFGTQTIYNIWNYQANHVVLTAGKTAEATGPGEITVMLVSHNIGAIPGSGMLTDTLPAGWWIDDFSVDPDYWIENVDGTVTMIWDISLPGYQDVPGMGGTTVFPYEEISYTLHPAWSEDGRRLVLPKAEITYQDGCHERTSESAFVVAINVDVDGDGAPACEDCDDGWEDVYPGAEELCDGVDNDCDNEIDEGCPICGNGIVEEGEICDDGEANVDAPNHCQTWCALSMMWPASGQATVAWEDLPSQGGNDWDYNDWVVEVETEYFFTTEGVVQMALYTDPWARGAAYHHAQGMFIGMGTYNSAGSYVVKTYDEQWGDLTAAPAVVFGNDEDILVEMWEDSWDVLPPNEINGDKGQFSFDANTEPGYGIVLGPKVGVEFEFDTPLAMTPEELMAHVPGNHCENMPYEFFLHVYNTGESISTGDARMLCVPDTWDWPAETVSIWNAYPGVVQGAPGAGPVFSPGWYLDDPIGSVWYP